ncbi:MAG: hypothetical protein ACXW30_03340 [Micavibrio sp.]
MALLEDFTKDQRDLLVGLPYRVGLWVSLSDSTGGGEANEAEAEALAAIVTGFSEDFCKSEFVQAMIEETVSRRSEWREWTRNLDDVPGECIRATDLLTERLERKEVTSFKLTLMEIATSVAMAYRESDHNQDFSFRLKVYGRVMVERLRAVFTGQRARGVDEFLNISDAEQKALDVLSQTLDLGNARAQSNISRNTEVA